MIFCFHHERKSSVSLLPHTSITPTFLLSVYLEFWMSSHRLTRKLVAIGLPKGLAATLLNKVLTSFIRMPESSLNIISSKLIAIDHKLKAVQNQSGSTRTLLVEASTIFAASGSDEESGINFCNVLIESKIPFGFSPIFNTRSQDDTPLVR